MAFETEQRPSERQIHSFVIRIGAALGFAFASILLGIAALISGPGDNPFALTFGGVAAVCAILTAVLVASTSNLWPWLPTLLGLQNTRLH